MQSLMGDFVEISSAIVKFLFVEKRLGTRFGQFWDFSKIHLFPKIRNFKSFGKAGGNSYTGGNNLVPFYFQWREAMLKDKKISVILRIVLV